MRLAFAAVALLITGSLSAQTPPRWTATRDLRIGDVDDPEYAITSIRSLLIARDGSMYALQDQTEVRVFGPDGKARFKFGRRGEGPGEFTGASRMGWKGDTIWIYDSRLSRISLFQTDGKFITSMSAHNPAQSPTIGTVSAHGLLADGSMVGGVAIASDDVANGRVTETSLFRISRTGSGENARGVLDTLATYSLKNVTHLITDPSNPRGTRSYGQQPFADNPMVITSPRGDEVYVTDRLAATRNATATFTVTRRDLRGHTVYRREFNYLPTRLPKALVDSVVRVRVATATRSAGAGFAPAVPVDKADQLVRRNLYVPEFIPPVQQVIVGDDGTLWLRRESLGRGTNWLVLDANGVSIGSLDLPNKVAVIAARRGYVWGQELDELDINYLVRYRIAPAPAPRC